MQSVIEKHPPPARGVRIIRAAHLGMCFGVRDAIALAHEEARTQPLTILGELVHNETVTAELRERGVGVEHRAEDVATSTIMITAHGASDQSLQALKDRGLRVLEATCPLVHYAHRAVKSLARENFHLVIIGRRGHVEVLGLTGDLAEFDIVLTEEDVLQLAPRPRFGIVAQTTQPIERVRVLAALIGRRFPGSEIRLIDTVCQPTKQRQAAAVELARRADVVIVVGGVASNNTRELAATCRRYCARVHQVADARGVAAAWLRDAKTVGLTAGTSTPDYIIDEVELRLQTLAESPNTDSSP